KLSIPGTQGISLTSDAKLKLPAEDPVRLIFGVRVRPVLRARRGAPLKYATAFIAEPRLQVVRVGRRWLTPALNLNVHINDSAIKEGNAHVCILVFRVPSLVVFWP